ncbi:MAG TPA: thiamine phosphate synthase [Candidatus Acidoferrales bacterium]|nr:thiamine phosphate synthase [Candidatus Acidoferrales bacterium]
MLQCYVTDRRLLEGEPSSPTNEVLLLRIGRAAANGVDWIQIREKDLSARELLELTRGAIATVQSEATEGSQVLTRVLVNDRLDVALAAGAAGVHLGGGSIPIGKVVPWVRARNAPADFLVTLSCHDIDEAIEAERAGANYIFFGPVYDTPSKIGLGAPQGIDKLAEICRRVRIPVLSIGGINEGNADACVRAGAAGIAAIRLFQQPEDDSTLAGIVSRLRAIA